MAPDSATANERGSVRMDIASTRRPRRRTPERDVGRSVTSVQVDPRRRQVSRPTLADGAAVVASPPSIPDAGDFKHAAGREPAGNGNAVARDGRSAPPSEGLG